MTTRTPEPPYTAVIFTSTRARSDDAAYAAMATRMEQMAAAQPGYLGLDSVRDPVSRFGITVSYWRDEASARAWKEVAEHRKAQRLGRAHWYEHYTVRVATVEREYEGPDPHPPADAQG